MQFSYTVEHKSAETVSSEWWIKLHSLAVRSLGLKTSPDRMHNKVQRIWNYIPGLFFQGWLGTLAPNNVALNTDALFWLSLCFLCCGASTGWTHITSRIAKPAVMQWRSTLIGMVTMGLIEWTSLPGTETLTQSITSGTNWIAKFRSSTTVQSQWRNLHVFFQVK